MWEARRAIRLRPTRIPLDSPADPGESAGIRRCHGTEHGTPGSAPSSPHLLSPVSTGDGLSTHGTRWGRHPRPAYRGEQVVALVRLNESEPFDGIDLVSLANQAAAFDRISRSRRSCLFSRPRRVSSSRSAVVKPSFRLPSSRSACSTQLWMAWAEGSNSRESSSELLPARSSSTIRRLKSGGYGGCDFGMTDTSSSKDYSVHESGSTPSRMHGRCRLNRVNVFA